MSWSDFLYHECLRSESYICYPTENFDQLIEFLVVVQNGKGTNIHSVLRTWEVYLKHQVAIVNVEWSNVYYKRNRRIEILVKKWERYI